MYANPPISILSWIMKIAPLFGVYTYIYIYCTLQHTTTHCNIHVCKHTHFLYYLPCIMKIVPFHWVYIYIYIYCTLQHTATHLQHTCNTHVCKPTHFYTIMDYKQSAFSRNINMYMSFAPCTTLQHTATYMHANAPTSIQSRTMNIMLFHRIWLFFFWREYRAFLVLQNSGLFWENAGLFLKENVGLFYENIGPSWDIGFFNGKNLGLFGKNPGALLRKYRFLLRECRTLLKECRALLREYRALWKEWRVFCVWSRKMEVRGNHHGFCACCSVLQRVAICCSVWQFVAVCCSVFQFYRKIEKVRCDYHGMCVLQHVTVSCSELQCVAVFGSVLQWVAVCCSVL